jgi:hypothetical protein
VYVRVDVVHRAKATRLRLPLLLPTLRELLISQLTSDSWGPELSLKEYLGYVDFDLPYTDWWVPSLNGWGWLVAGTCM